MTDQEEKNLFMDYLYDEMDHEQRIEFEKQLEENPELKREFEELKSTKELLQFVPLETPPHKLVMMAPQPDFKKAPKISLRKFPGLATVLTAAACLLVILLTAAFVDLQVGQTGQGFYVNFGGQSLPQQQPGQQGLDEGEVREMIEQIRQENSVLLASMIEQIQQQQNEQLEEAINVLTTYYDQRRQQDLMLISEGLSRLEEDTYYRLRQTDETLGDLIYALSYPSTQSTQE